MLYRLIFIFCIAVLTTVNASAQTPKSVLDAFSEKYPDVKNATWNPGDKNTYEVDFESDDIAYTAVFSNDGKWVQTESSLESDDLPPLVKEGVAKEFDGYLVTEAELVDSHDRGRLYSVHIERGEETIVVLLDEDGKILSRERDSDEG